MAGFVDILEHVLVPLAWPLLAAVLLWRLFPLAVRVITSRSFALKFAGVEISVQEATEQINVQLQDLKEQVIELRKYSGHFDSHRPPVSAKDDIPKTILWVDDRPAANAMERSQLEDRGYTIIQAVSTQDGMVKLAGDRVGLIISDMGRTENGIYVPQAGIIFLKAAREAGYNQPFMVYSTKKYLERNDASVKDHHGDGATASPTDLLEWIEGHFVQAER